MDRLTRDYRVVDIGAIGVRLLKGSDFLSDNFQVWEFVSTDKSETVLYSQSIVNDLQRLRDRVNRSVSVHSGDREPILNRSEEVGGTPEGEHEKGEAVDISVRGYTPDRVATMLNEIGGYYTNIGVYTTHTHYGKRGYHRRKVM